VTTHSTTGTTRTDVTTATLDVTGAGLHYELRGHGPLVLLIGTPMDADSFAPLADLLATEHTVLTTDTRGIRRSCVDDPDADPSIETRADDLARLITHVDRGPAAVLGSSGGAVTVLALAQNHPEAVRTVVAHEPPLTELLPDRAERHAGAEDMISKWFAGDYEGSWRAFLANANIHLPEEVFQAVFGGEPDAQTRADTDYQYGHLFRPSTHWRPDVARLREVAPQVVVGIGEASAQQVCDRTSRALAARLETEPVLFPGGHIGFVDDPVAFAPHLRAVLDAG